MPGGMLRKESVAAAIVIPSSLAALPVPLVNNVEAMACRAQIAASATPETGQSDLFPEIVIEVLVKPRLDLFHVQAYRDIRYDRLRVFHGHEASPISGTLS